MLRLRNWSLIISMAVLVCGCACVKPKPWPITGLPSPPPPTQPFTVTWDARDLNGMPLNPQWADQRDHHELPPVPNDENQNKCVRRPDRPECTAQQTVIDKPPFIGWGLLCDLIPGSQIHGHVDWLPASYGGYLRWIHTNADFDYNFSLFPSDDDGLTQNNQHYGDKQFIEVEYDSRETDERFVTPTWQKFTDAAASGDPDDMAKWLNPKSPETPPNTVMTGLFNLDCEHDCRSEVHPIYAIAVETNDSPDDDTWAIFARNWGDGGSCSGYNHQLELPKGEITVLLPSKNTKPATIPTGKIEFGVSSIDIAFPAISFIPGTGYALTFKLPDPKGRPLAELVLHLQWPAGTPVPARPKLAAPVRALAAPVREENAENYLATLFQQVGAKPPAAAKPHLAAEFMTPAFAPARNKAVAPPASIKVKTYLPPPPPKPPAPGQAVARVAHVTDEVKLLRDEAVFRELCAAYKAKGKDLPTDKIPNLPKLCQSPELQ